MKKNQFSFLLIAFMAMAISMVASRQYINKQQTIAKRKALSIHQKSLRETSISEKFQLGTRSKGDKK